VKLYRPSADQLAWHGTHHGHEVCVVVWSFLDDRGRVWWNWAASRDRRNLGGDHRPDWDEASAIREAFDALRREVQS